MKKYSLFWLMIFFTIPIINAQNRSCDAAYRFDANYTRSLDQLEALTIKLQIQRQTTNPIEAGRKNNAIQSFFAVLGNASSKQFTSIEANIGFNTCYVLQPNLELYKAEVKNGMRTFTVPAGTGGSRSVNIPIQVITPPGTKTSTGQVVWGRGTFIIKFINGYLQPGEYILIDKNSLSPDGSLMKGYGFTIR